MKEININNESTKKLLAKFKTFMVAYTQRGQGQHPALFALMRVVLHAHSLFDSSTEVYSGPFESPVIEVTENMLDAMHNT